MRPRPEIGTQTTKIVKIPVCKGCGCALDDTNLCSDDCDHDGEKRTPENTFNAVYQRVETFKGDEEYKCGA